LKGVQGGFFLGKKPLEYVLSVYTNSENAIGPRPSQQTQKALHCCLRGNRAACAEKTRASNLMMAEDIVLFAVAAVRALQATDQEHGHADRHQDGEGVIGGCKPLDQAIHPK
jgi:hypothetical protein